MRLLIAANSFYPSVGGYEGVSLALAQELCARGHVVRIVTFTEEPGSLAFPFEIYRNPDALTLLKLVQWSQIYIQNNVSLRLIWPLLIFRRPLVCIHHGIYQEPGATFPWKSRLKRLIAGVSTRNIAVSQAVAEALPGKSRVVPNPYQDDLFCRIPSIPKDRDLIFVGRLVSDKGVDLLIEALALLCRRDLQPSLTIVGSGPEEASLQSKVQMLGVGHLVEFAGQITGSKLNELINAHKIMVVPSRWNEPFGIVALEGIACGCVVVGSRGGGLPEAIGPCGVTVPNNDAAALANALHDLLTHSGNWPNYLSNAKAHLHSHRRSAAVEKYLEILVPLVKPDRR